MIQMIEQLWWPEPDIALPRYLFWHLRTLLEENCQPNPNEWLICPWVEWTWASDSAWRSHCNAPWNRHDPSV